VACIPPDIFEVGKILGRHRRICHVIWFNPMKTLFPLPRVSADPQLSKSIRYQKPALLHALIFTCSLAVPLLHGADGTVYYNRVSSPSQIPTVRAIRANGTNDRPIPIGLPFAAHPVVSRDGNQLLVTSADPIH
jgi:hypothetical protein